MIPETFLTTRQIVDELDKYIIGQKDAKRTVSIALRNRWRRMNAPLEMQKEIVPGNILMIGATGVGKTEIARRLAKLADAPFVKVEASKFTEVGYVGRDVESMVRDLVEQAVKLVTAEKKEEVKVKAATAVEERLLDIIIPPLRKNESSPSDDVELNEKTRERFREKLKDGELDNREIEISVQQNNSPNIGVMGGPGMMDEASLDGIKEMLSGIMPQKYQKRKVTVIEGRRVLLEEEASKLIDMDDVKDLAIRRAENTGIVFIDEIDKIAKSGGASGPDVSREGVQRDLLPIVEGSAINTKYGIINTDHILFIAAGAFHVSKPSDLIPELQGRFPIRVELDKLTKNDFIAILQSPKSALTKQYQALFMAEDVELSFENEAIEQIAEIAFEANNQMENIGARRLHTVMSVLLNDFLFDVPDLIPANSKIVITKEHVKEKLSYIVKNIDLGRFIL